MVRRFGLSRSAVSVAAAVVFLAGLASGCARSDEVMLASSAIELSDALAFRDGEPSITVVEPANYSVVTSPFLLVVETENFRLSPAGETRDGEGHLHVLIDQDCLSAGVVIHSGSKVVDLNDGRRKTELELGPGTYEICVQVGDGFSTAVRIIDQISVTVIGEDGLGSLLR